jgi:ribosomal silencing factor RsfS
MKRVCIYPKDVQWITGKSERQSRDIVAKIKKHYKKEKHQSLSIEEFCEYMGLNINTIQPLIK